VSNLLFREVLVPVCAPELLGRGAGRISIRDLRIQKLLHAVSAPGDWKAWLTANGVKGIDARAGIVFEQPHLAVQAAADGLGIAIADRWLVHDDLAAGRLIVPFEGALARAEGYYVVGRESARDSLHIGAFWRWLLTQAAGNPFGRESMNGGST
jgi:LysR family transcriptional regulator, glycine cleavage system transcriptional activator